LGFEDQVSSNVEDFPMLSTVLAVAVLRITDFGRGFDCVSELNPWL
jgi:hypothetical protein